MSIKEIFKCNNRGGRIKTRLFAVFAAAFFISAVLISLPVSANAESLPEGVSESQINGALKDLSGLYGSEITSVAEAKAICNLEKYISECAEIGKKHKLYEPEEEKQVDIVLTEIKGKIISDLKACVDEACLIEVANRLAENLAKKAPTVARELDLTEKKIGEKKIIVETAKEIGVNIEDCRAMDPDTASVELLRSCAKLAKSEKIQNYLPPEAKKAAELNDATLNLKESLSKKEFECGDGSLDGCGNFCLNPSAEAREKGFLGIPQVCRQIAEKFFGTEGISQLETAYLKVKETSDLYHKRVKNIVFTTSDNRILTDPAVIGKYLEQEGKRGNVEAIEKGMDFMVAKGFVSKEDKEFAVNMVRKIREQGKEMDFDECEKNPESCEEFIPEEERNEFNAMREVRSIMAEEMRKAGIPSGNPEFCEESPRYGELCLAASRNALPRLEELSQRFPEIKFILNEIRERISFGEKGLEARRRAEEKFRGNRETINIGDKTFTNFSELDAFCRENGALCLTEATKKGMIDRDFADKKYKEYEDANARNAEKERIRCAQSYYAPAPCANGYFRQETKNEFGCSFWGDCEPLPDFKKQTICPSLPTVSECPEGQEKRVTYSSSECGTYYGCFDKKTETQTSAFPHTFTNGKIVNSYEEARSYCYANGPGSGQGIAAECEAKFGIIYQTNTACPSGQYWYVPYGGGGGYCRNQNDTTNTTPTGTCGSEFAALLGTGCHKMAEAYFNGSMDKYVRPDTNAVVECRATYISGCTVWNTGYSSSTNGTYNTCPNPDRQYWNGSACVDITNTQTNTSYSTCDSGLIGLLGEGCHAMFTDSSGNQIFCDGPMSKSAKRGDATTTAGCSSPSGGANTCPSGQYWNGSACAQTSTTDCVSGQYWNGASCVNSTSSNTCGTGQYWNGAVCVNSTLSSSLEDTREKCYDGSDNDLDTFVDANDPGCASFYTSGTTNTNNTTNSSSQCPTFSHEMSGYCMLNNDTSRCADYPNASSEGNYSNTVCQRYSGANSSGASSCTTNQYWTGTYCAPLNTSSSCPSGQYWYNGACTSTSATNCPSGQYWNGSACTYTNCASGQYWNGSSCVNSDSSTSGSGTTCGTGQYWNGSTCVNSDASVSSCPSGQYVNGACAYPETWSTGSSGSGTTCGSGQYWNGSACVQTSTTDCTSGQYWNGSACVSSETQSTGGQSSSCPSGQYWDGSACVNSTSPTSFLRTKCPKNHKWSGDYCVVKAQYGAHFLASVRTVAHNAASVLMGLFK